MNRVNISQLNRFNRLLAIMEAKGHIPAIKRDSSDLDRLTFFEAMEVLENRFSEIQNNIIFDFARCNNLIPHPGFSINSMQCGYIDREESVLYNSTYMDHPVFFCRPNNIPKIITVDLYAPDAIDIANEFADKNNLNVLVPPNPTVSWHFPGECTFVVYATKEIDIEWLPEHYHDIYEK